MEYDRKFSTVIFGFFIYLCTENYIFELELFLVFYIHKVIEFYHLLIAKQMYLLYELGVEVKRVGRYIDMLHRTLGKLLHHEEIV